MKNFLTDHLKYVPLYAIVTALTYCLLHFIVTPLSPTYEDCGKIISKPTKEVVGKYEFNKELYLYVDFDLQGKKSIEVSLDTYLNAKENERICFKIPAQDYTYNVINFIGLSVLSVIILLAVGFYLYYILELH